MLTNKTKRKRIKKSIIINLVSLLIIIVFLYTKSVKENKDIILKGNISNDSISYVGKYDEKGFFLFDDNLSTVAYIIGYSEKYIPFDIEGTFEINYMIDSKFKELDKKENIKIVSVEKIFENNKDLDYIIYKENSYNSSYGFKKEDLELAKQELNKHKLDFEVKTIVRYKGFENKVYKVISFLILFTEN